MADDIVTRLRAVLNAATVEEQQDIVDDVADGLERLQAEVDRLRAALVTAHKVLRNLDPVDDGDLGSWWNQWGGHDALTAVQAALESVNCHN